MHKNTKQWEWGQKAKLAKLAGISRQYLNNILAGRRCDRELARTLEEQGRTISIFISRYDWMESDTTTNPLFHNKKRAE